MYFARIARSFPAMRTPKCKSSEKYGLCGKRSLKRSKAGLVKLAGAYGGLLSCTVHVLISLLGFVPSPDFIFPSAKLRYEFGALFFLLPSKLHSNNSFCRILPSQCLNARQVPERILDWPEWSPALLLQGQSGYACRSPSS